MSKRNDIIDLGKVMGETKQQFSELEKTIKAQKLEIEELKKVILEKEAVNNRDNAQRERIKNEMQEF
jgi:septal ring factor EnvC (AmiA/AmiB activator)